MHRTAVRTGFIQFAALWQIRWMTDASHSCQNWIYSISSSVTNQMDDWCIAQLSELDLFNLQLCDKSDGWLMHRTAVRTVSHLWPESSQFFCLFVFSPSFSSISLVSTLRSIYHNCPVHNWSYPCTFYLNSSCTEFMIPIQPTFAFSNQIIFQCSLSRLSQKLVLHFMTSLHSQVLNVHGNHVMLLRKRDRKKAVALRSMPETVTDR